MKNAARIRSLKANPKQRRLKENVMGASVKKYKLFLQPKPLEILP